jgi:hypothetical protein
VTLTTDASGQVMIPIIADGLFAPALTISGGGLSSSVTVSPSEPINHYMAGAGTLNFLPVMDGDTLADATTSDGAPVYPLAKQDKTVAIQAASVLAGAAKAGADPKLKDLTVAGPAQDGATDRDHHHGHGHDTRRGPGVGSVPARLGGPVTVEGVTLSFSDLTHDALYAIKTGAARVHDVAMVWDQSLGRWVGHVTADFEAWLQREVAVTIETLQDAAHVFHSVLNHVGAVLDEVVDWLKAHVLKLLQDTVRLAARYDGWMLQTADELHALILQAKDRADGFFASQKTQIHQELDKLKTLLGTATIDSLTKAPRLARQPSLGAAQSSLTDVSNPSSRWLVEKATQANPSASKQPTVSDDLHRLLQDLEAKLSAEGQDFLGAATDFAQAITTLVSNPKTFGTVGVDKLLDAFGHVIDAALDLADLLVDVVLDLFALIIDMFKQVIAIPLDRLSLVGALLKQAGFTDELTIGRIATLNIAFPTALAWKIDQADSDAQLFDNVSKSSRLLGGASAKSLAFGAMFTEAFMAMVDGFVAVMRGATPSAPPDLFIWLDIAGPIVIGALTVPAHDGGLPFSSPIHLKDLDDVLVAIEWGVGTVPGWCATVRSYAATISKGDPEERKAIDSLMLTVTSFFGFIGAGFGILTALITSDTQDDAKLAAIAAVLSNVSPMLAVFLDDLPVEETDGLSAILVGVIGAIGTIASAIISYQIA